MKKMDIIGKSDFEGEDQYTASAQKFKFELFYNEISLILQESDSVSILVEGKAGLHLEYREQVWSPFFEIKQLIFHMSEDRPSGSLSARVGGCDK